MNTRDHPGGPGEEVTCARVTTLPAPDVFAVCREIGNRILFQGLDGNPFAAGFIAQRVEGWLADHADRIGPVTLQDLARRLDLTQPPPHREERR